MINPTWEPVNKYDMEDVDEQYEACASVPSIAGIVERYKNIILEYYDEEGTKIKKEITGFFARLIQHECDHLNGKVFLDWVDNGNFATKEMVKKYRMRESKSNLKDEPIKPKAEEKYKTARRIIGEGGPSKGGVNLGTPNKRPYPPPPIRPLDMR